MSYILQSTGQNQTIMEEPVESKMFRAQVLDEQFHKEKNIDKRTKLVTVNAWFTKNQSGAWQFNFEDGPGGETRSMSLEDARETQRPPNIIGND